MLNAIKVLKQEGVKNIALSMVATPNNARYESKFLQMCKNLDVEPVIRNFEEGGRGEVNSEMFKAAYSEAVPDPLNVVPDKKAIRKTTKVCCCKAGLDSLSIEENGDIKVCTLLSDESIVGNLKDISSLKDFLHQSTLFSLPAYQYFNGLWPDSSDYCKNCDVNLFCWTCPHELELHLQNKKNFADTCIGKKEFLSEIVWGD